MILHVILRRIYNKCYFSPHWISSRNWGGIHSATSLQLNAHSQDNHYAIWHRSMLKPYAFISWQHCYIKNRQMYQRLFVAEFQKVVITAAKNIYAVIFKLWLLLILYLSLSLYTLPPSFTSRKLLIPHLLKDFIIVSLLTRTFSPTLKH